jgi:hypothetical protein
MMRLLIIFILSIVLVGCLPKNLTGIYSSYVDHGVLTAGCTYNFHQDGTFEVKYWSDDISSNRIGKGTYALRNGNLLLNFDDVEPITSSYYSHIIPDEGNEMSKLTFLIKDQSGNPLTGVNIIIQDVGGEFVASGGSQVNGTCTILIPRTDIPKSIKISYVGMEGLEIPFPDSSPRAFEINLVTKTGYIDVGEKRVYRLRTRGDYLNLKSERGAIVLKRKQPGS